MKTTPNYGLQTPEGNDTVGLVSTLTSNMDAVDLVLFSLGQSVQQLFGTTTVLLSGGVATKDGTTLSQLDVSAADIYFAGGQHREFAASATGQYKTVTASTTYYLDYNPDGTTSWGTAHSTVAGYTTICTVTADASGNISTITDTRPTVSSLLSGKGFVMQAQLGQANGVAPLDGNKQVPVANLPAMDYVPSSEVGSANGVASLDANKQVPASQLGNVPPVPAASESTPGVLKTTGTSGVAVTNDDPVYEHTARTDEANTFTGIQTAPAFAVSGIAGATTSTRIVGGTNGSAPTAGTWNVGDEVTDVTGTKWICTVAGTPGTWVKIKSGVADNANELNGQPASYYATASQANSTASGTWTPASGTFNVAVGTVINIAAVPANAKNFEGFGSANNVNYTSNIIGVTTSNGVYWMSGSGDLSGAVNSVPSLSSTACSLFASGVSSNPNYFLSVYDGSYMGRGYLQINNGYLQFVILYSGINTDPVSLFAWGVS